MIATEEETTWQELHDMMRRRLKIALQLVTDASTLQELRQGQAILLPALTGATLDTTAEILGLSRDRVCVLRRQFSELSREYPDGYRKTARWTPPGIDESG